MGRLLSPPAGPPRRTHSSDAMRPAPREPRAPDTITRPSVRRETSSSLLVSFLFSACQWDPPPTQSCEAQEPRRENPPRPSAAPLRFPSQQSFLVRFPSPAATKFHLQPERRLCFLSPHQFTTNHSGSRCHHAGRFPAAVAAVEVPRRLHCITPSIPSANPLPLCSISTSYLLFAIIVIPSVGSLSSGNSHLFLFLGFSIGRFAPAFTRQCICKSRRLWMVWFQFRFHRHALATTVAFAFCFID